MTTHDQTHDALVRELTGYVANTLGNWYGEAALKRCQEICPPAFNKLPDRTIDLLAKFGREDGRDAVPEHLGIQMLVNVDADEQSYLYYALMRDAVNYLSPLDEFDPDLVVPICVSFALYEPYIDSWASDAPNSIEGRTGYYKALAEVVESLLNKGESALRYVQLLPDTKPFKASPVLKDERLIELVIRNANHVETISGYIRERGVYDPEVIAQFLNDYHRAVSDGAL